MVSTYGDLDPLQFLHSPPLKVMSEVARASHRLIYTHIRVVLDRQQHNPTTTWQFCHHLQGGRGVQRLLIIQHRVHVEAEAPAGESGGAPSVRVKREANNQPAAAAGLLTGWRRTSGPESAHPARRQPQGRPPVALRNAG